MTASDLAALVAQIPFAATLGIDINDVAPEKVTGTMPWSAERCTSGGISTAAR